MTAKRYKRASKILTFFKYNYKISPPYRVLVDGTFCMAALSNKINLREQLPKYLDGEVEIVTTKCVLEELKQIGSAVYGALAICKQFTVDVCPHTTCRPAGECLAHLARRATKGTKYLIGTQDDELTEKLRKIVGTPILYIKYNSILIDRVSQDSKLAAEGAKSEIDRVKELKKEILGETQVVKRKKKKVKGKNPLSCKKKIVKKTVPVPTGNRTSAGKRKRNKKKDGGNHSSSPPVGSTSVTGTTSRSFYLFLAAHCSSPLLEILSCCWK